MNNTLLPAVDSENNSSTAPKAVATQPRKRMIIRACRVIRTGRIIVPALVPPGMQQRLNTFPASAARKHPDYSIPHARLQKSCHRQQVSHF